MALGYKIEKQDDLPVIVVKITFPPRLDIERMFVEIARQINSQLGDLSHRVYRINDLSTYNLLNIATQVIRGLASEVRGWPGTNSDPRIYPVFVGKGANVRLLVEALRHEKYGRWNVASFETLDDALEQIRKWESGQEERPSEKLPPEDKHVKTVF